jgi:hypothetical protein
MLFVRWYLWLAPNVLLLPCLYGLLRRGNHQTFPLFVAYIAAQLAVFAAALPVALALVGSPSYMLVSRRVLIADVGVSGLLGLGVMYELADKLIATRASLKPVMQHLMRWTVAFLILIAAFSTALIPQSGIEQIMKVFQVLDFSSNLVKLGLLLVLVGFSRVLRVSWRSLPAGIALGFAVSAAAEMAAAPLFSELGRSYYQRLDLIRMVAFHACVLIWLVYIFLPGNPPSFSGHRPDRTDLEAWDQELQKMVR